MQFTLLGSLYFRHRQLKQELLALGHALCVWEGFIMFYLIRIWMWTKEDY